MNSWVCRTILGVSLLGASLAQAQDQWQWRGGVWGPRQCENIARREGFRQWVYGCAYQGLYYYNGCCVRGGGGGGGGEGGTKDLDVFTYAEADGQSCLRDIEYEVSGVRCRANTGTSNLLNCRTTRGDLESVMAEIRMVRCVDRVYEANRSLALGAPSGGGTPRSASAMLQPVDLENVKAISCVSASGRTTTSVWLDDDNQWQLTTFQEKQGGEPGLVTIHAEQTVTRQIPERSPVTSAVFSSAAGHALFKVSLGREAVHYQGRVNYDKAGRPVHAALPTCTIDVR